MSASTEPQSNTEARDDAPVTDWYRVAVEDAAARLGTPVVSGLSKSEARKRLDRYGPNEVADSGDRNAWHLLLSQFTGVLTLVLFAAAVLSVFLGDLLDAAAILAIVLLNAALGFFQEHRAEQSVAALKRMAAPVVRVRRDGQFWRSRPPRDLLVAFAAGAVVLLSVEVWKWVLRRSSADGSAELVLRVPFATRQSRIRYPMQSAPPA